MATASTTRGPLSVKIRKKDFGLAMRIGR
jgi:hypothetical protein